MDEAEYTAWVAGCQHQLLRSAYLVTGDLHRAEDLVQDALVKVALRWGRLREGNPTAYGRDDATARAYLPIRDGASTYSDNANLTVHGWLDDETVLAWVRPREGDQGVGEEWYLVAWHFPSGELTRLAGGDGYARLTDVVASLLER